MKVGYTEFSFGYQFNKCAEWLNMKCSIVVDTACEKVRVTSALFDLPRISRAFALGEQSRSRRRGTCEKSGLAQRLHGTTTHPAQARPQPVSR